MNQYVCSDINFRDTASYKAAISVLHNINTDKALTEQLIYKDDSLPFNVWTDIYEYLIDNTVNCHWHTDFEYSVLLEGSVDYYINDTHIKMEKSDVLFVNSNVLHMSKQVKSSENAVMYTLTFSASLLSSNLSGTIYAKYLQPLINSKIDGFIFSEESAVGQEIKELLMKIYALNPSVFGYELECLGYFNWLWLSTFKYIEENKSNLLYRISDMNHSERLKEILSYIHDHFNEKITAADIANHVNISRGECFRCFKHFMNKTLVEYVNEYRLLWTAKYLRETEKSVIEIGANCGFENASYFNKVFKNAYSMTPYQYRKAQIWTDNTNLNINNYDYEYWKDSGNGTMIITANANNGSFICEWHNINNITFRSGKKFRGYERTHKQLGHITLKYDASCHSNGSSFLNVYGWTVDPLIEWYIVECSTDFSPPEDSVFLGTHDTDDGTYALYCAAKQNSPTILGIRDFSQYWSIRTVGRFCGIVNVSAHLCAWENMGLTLGSLAEIALSVEGLQSSGKATANTNILTIKPIADMEVM